MSLQLVPTPMMRSALTFSPTVRRAAPARVGRFYDKLFVAYRRSERLLAEGHEREASRQLFNALDDALLQGEFGEVNQLLSRMTFDAATAIDLVVTVLMITKPAAERLSHREETREKFIAWLRASEPTRAPQIVPYL